MRRIHQIIFFTFLVLFFSGSTVFAQSAWVNQFLARYRPAEVQFPATAAGQQNLTNMIRNGQIPLSVNDMINLVISNNLDFGLNRLAPLSSQYALLSTYRPFEPALTLSALANETKVPSSSVFGGAPTVIQLNRSYVASFTQNLQTGTNLGVNLSLNRSSTNSAFTSFNPAWTSTITYSFLQHLTRNFGRQVNLRPVRIAENNKQISDLQFEQQVIDLVVQAQKAYWDLVFD